MSITFEFEHCVNILSELHYSYIIIEKKIYSNRRVLYEVRTILMALSQEVTLYAASSN